MENQEDGGNFYSKKVSGLVLRVKVQSDSRAQTPRTPRTPREDDEEVITKVQVCILLLIIFPSIKIFFLFIKIDFYILQIFKCPGVDLCNQCL